MTHTLPGNFTVSLKWVAGRVAVKIAPRQPDRREWKRLEHELRDLKAKFRNEVLSARQVDGFAGSPANAQSPAVVESHDY